jgi:hypothetical protein
MTTSQQQLDPDPTPLQEPNRIPGLVAPTTHSAGATQEAKKYNYVETFDREPFIATRKNGLEAAMVH